MKQYIVVYEGKNPRIVRADTVKDLFNNELAEIEIIYSAKGTRLYHMGVWNQSSKPNKFNLVEWHPYTCTECETVYTLEPSLWGDIHKHQGLCPECSQKYK